MSFIEINESPEIVSVQVENDWLQAEKQMDCRWSLHDVEVTTSGSSECFHVNLRAKHTAVRRILLRWRRDVSSNISLLGDHWERGYGDLEWRSVVHERVMPWYFLMNDGSATHGYGVKTGPKAMCFWQVNEMYITLCLDVRCGGSGVLLSDKSLHTATVVTRKGNEGESPFDAAREFCAMMCEKPRLPSQPVYGGNNWYYAYGNSSHKQILEDTKLIASWTASTTNKPFMVIDDGWQLCHSKTCNGGPWISGNYRFPDMPKLAEEMKAIGTKPGIWVRPLLTEEKVPYHCILPEKRFKSFNNQQFLDPSTPEALAMVGKDIKRITSWGYELIKHDFSTYDILGRWGFEMNSELTNNDWHFNDQSKTTAEIILELYTTIRKAAGKALIIGCNTIGHLGAGLFEIQRTGDDTSGMQWERTRKMGVNTLAFRMSQHDTFSASDADCVGLTKQIPWELNKQWLELLSSSGTPLFISANPDAVGKEQEKAIKEAFRLAAQNNLPAEPMDWMQTTCPRKWLINGDIVNFDWYEKDKIDFCR